MAAGRFFRKNFQTFPAEEFRDPFLTSSFCIYEVVRTDDGIPLFLEDHIERLQKSFAVAGKKVKIDAGTLKGEIIILIRLNGIKEGLIRIVYCFNDESADVLLFNSRVKFPAREDYVNGVVCELMQAERKEPEAKVYIPSVREKANKIIRSGNVYEVLLVNSDNRITEGSRSNVFFIKNNEITTAPDAEVLHGITRKKVIGIIEKLGIPLRYGLTSTEQLQEAEAVFITGTTPKVLPVRKIGNYEFNPKHPLISQILEEYNRMIEEYKKPFRQKG